MKNYSDSVLTIDLNLLINYSIYFHFKLITGILVKKD